MRRRGFWQVYLVAGIVALLVVGMVIYWNFYSPCRPQDAQLQYDNAQLIFTVVGIFGIVFSLLFATHQFARSQRSPQLRLGFADSLKISATVQIPPAGKTIHDVHLSVVNDGNTVAIWFEVIVDLSKIPWHGSYVAPAWAQVGEQYESNLSGFRLLSFGRVAVFTSTPLKIGVVQFFNVSAQRQSKYEIPYQINGDWGAPTKGSLWLNVELVDE